MKSLHLFLRIHLPLLIGLALLGTAVSGTAAGISLYGVVKGRDFEQTSTNAPSPATPDGFFFQAFAERSGLDEITGGFVQLPGVGGNRVLNPEQDGSGAFFEQGLASQGALDTSYGSGNYTLTIEHDPDIDIATVTLTGDSYPPAPRISNFDEAQQIDPVAAFTLRWDAFAGGTAADFIQIDIEDEFGDSVFSTPGPGQPGALNGTNTSVVIPAFALAGSGAFHAELLFAKVVDLDTISIPGAIGLAVYTGVVSFDLHSNVPDALFYVVAKERSYEQTSAAAPTPAPASPFSFVTFVEPSGIGTVTNATVRLPNATVKPLALVFQSEFELEEDFVSQVALDTAYPNGDYTLTIGAVNDGTRTPVLTLNGDNYPPAPHVSNFAAAQAIDPASDFILTWDAFAGATMNDIIDVDLNSCRGNRVDLDVEDLEGTATQLVISAGTLQSGQTYQLRIAFHRVIDFNTIDYPGAIGIAGYTAETLVPLATTGTPAGCTDFRFQLNFNYPRGTFAGGTTGIVTFPAGLKDYTASFRAEGDTNYPASVTFTGPASSGLSGTPSIYTFTNTGGSGMSVMYSTTNLNVPPYPGDGVYSVNYKGQPRDFNRTGLDVANRQVRLVPTVLLNPSGVLTQINWTFRDVNGAPVSPPAFISQIHLGVDGTSGRLHSDFNISPTATSRPVPGSIQWSNVTTIQISYADTEDDIYFSFWDRGSAPPQIGSVGRDGTGRFQFQVTGEPQRMHWIEATTNFTAWDILLTTNPPTGIINFTDQQSTTLPLRYYRVGAQ